MKDKISDMEFERFSHGQIKNNNANHKIMRDLLNKTGSGFCLAKWTQVTMHLGVGMTHSCHHPEAHKIPIDELKDNPSALHNTSIKKQARKEMLNGDRPKECDFCWRIEDNTGEISDRVLKSMDQFSINDHDWIANDFDPDDDFNPRYVEVSFSNVCNLKCSYCGPTFSSKWAEEIKQNGPYPLEIGGDFNDITDISLKTREDNPYTNAFWKWFPDALPHMHTLRITGGEPLMSKHTFKVMDFLMDNPNPNLNFAVNSNGNPPDKLWKKFTEKVKQLKDNDCIATFTLFVSAENTEGQSEYTRYGMNWNLFKDNIEYFLDETSNTRVTFMSAFNILSIPSFKDFLEYVLFLRKKYNHGGMYKWMEDKGIKTEESLLRGLEKYRIQNMPTITERLVNNGRGNRVGVDIPYVRAPDFLDASIVTFPLLQDYLLPAVDFMYNNLSNEWQGDLGFEEWEALKLKRIFMDCLIKCVNRRNSDETSDATAEISLPRSRFYQFINEHDRRRGTDFLKIFPEMKDFYYVCEKEYQKIKDDTGFKSYYEKNKNNE